MFKKKNYTILTRKVKFTGFFVFNDQSKKKGLTIYKSILIAKYT